MLAEYEAQGDTALALLGRPAESLASARIAAQGEPGNPLFRNLLGVALVAARISGRTDVANAAVFGYEAANRAVPAPPPEASPHR